MSNNNFEQFFSERLKAADSYCDGDIGPLLKLVPKEGIASFHSPDGETVFGATSVVARFGERAASLTSGGASQIEVLQKVVSGELGFWTGFQTATLNIQGRDDPTHMKIRVTEVFRRIDGAWKLIHRHADRGAKK